MKTQMLHSIVILLVGTSLALTSCQYPSNMGASPRAGTVYRTAGGGVLGSLAGSAIGSNRDRYYYLSRSPAYSHSYSYGPYGRPSSPYPYYRHHYYSNSSYSSPYYSRSPSYNRSYTNRPWGGGYGFGQPSGWGTGLGIGSRWF